jgi:hypothetical protein
MAVSYFYRDALGLVRGQTEKAHEERFPMSEGPLRVEPSPEFLPLMDGRYRNQGGYSLIRARSSQPADFASMSFWRRTETQRAPPAIC